jgi:LuxR family transcriptional regulator, maltose regulon positive regulatory protein
MVTAALIDTASAPAGAPWGDRPVISPLSRAVLHAVVRRPAIVRALEAGACSRVVSLVAPAGYGKTTVLREWADHNLRPFAWVRLDRRHDDAGRLLAAAARAVDEAVGDADGSAYVLVLDDVDAITAPDAVAALQAIATGLPPGTTLALASRREPPLPLSRMRAERAVAEIGPRDLAMTRTEAAALLRASGHHLDRRGVETLWHVTEGWPVGLSLAARFLDEWGTDGNLRRFSGADRLVARYVRDEILAGLPPHWSEVLLRTSVLERLTAPLCDAVLGHLGSAAILSGLASAGLLVPLDRREERFRHHRLIAAALRAQLRRQAPPVEPAVHRAASRWYRRAGDVDGAVRHALLAGDVRAAAAHVWANVAEAVAQGRITTLERWLAGFSPAQIAGEPSLALTAGICELMRGQGHLVEHWATAAAAVRGHGAPTPEVEPAVSILRAAMGDGGPAAMRDDAERVLRSLADGSPWRSLCCLVSGVAARLLGSSIDAAPRLEDGARRAAVSAPHLHALCLGELAVLALERDDWDGAEEVVTRARRQLDRHGLARFGTAALVFAASAVVRGQRGRIGAAQDDLAEAVRLQATLTDFAPWYEAELSVLISRAALRLSDAGLARESLARCERLLDRLPGAEGLRRSADDAERRLHSFTAVGSAPPASMTAAELRILGFLPTHLSFREIGERTFVSANTVKTQANAVYRKLDVSCRSDAVARARACGLLDA